MKPTFGNRKSGKAISPSLNGGGFTENDPGWFFKEIEKQGLLEEYRLDLAFCRTRFR